MQELPMADRHALLIANGLVTYSYTESVCIDEVSMPLTVVSSSSMQQRNELGQGFLTEGEGSGTVFTTLHFFPYLTNGPNKLERHITLG